MHPKELVVVLGLAVVIFTLARPIARAFTTDEDFKRRRNVWIGLTACAFLSPSFWFYAPVAFAVLAWAGRRDSNPAALYLFAFAIIPPVSVDIPIVLVNQLFPLSQARILAIAVLVPAAFRVFSVNEGGVGRRWNSLDWILLAFIALQIVLVIPYESSTNTLRRSFLFFIDTVLVYYVFSRTLISRRTLVDALATFTLICAIYGAVAIFESFKGWLLYEQIRPGWGLLNNGAFLLRGDSLRAQASAGHSLTLGYTLTVAFGFWLYLRAHVTSKTLRMATTGLFCLALYATHARGPWLTAVVVYFAFLFLAPGGGSALVKGLFGFAAVSGAILATPLGDRIVDTLPFIGTVDQENVIYRQRLAEESWRLVWHHPFFGDPFVAANLEMLRQGQGIIDLMNAYAGVALYFGLIGLCLFAGFFVISTIRTYTAQASVRTRSPDLAALGAALAAGMIGSLFFMATASVDWVEYVLAGMMAGYWSLVALGQQTGAFSNAASSPAHLNRYAFGKQR